MKKIQIGAALLIAAMALTAGTVSAKKSKKGKKHTTTEVAVMRKEGNVTIVNTATIASDVKGFKGATPLEVYFESGKILKVVALPNRDTPDFFGKVRQQLLPKWDGMTAAKAATAQVDGVTGATYSSRAVKENVKRAAEYYNKHQ